MSSNETIKVVSLRPSVRQDVVEMAKAILSKAESGEIVDLSWCSANADGSIATAYTPTEDSHRRLAAVSRLLHRLHMAGEDQAV